MTKSGKSVEHRICEGRGSVSLKLEWGFYIGE